MSDFNQIITIGRECGSGGRTIAQHISKILDIPFYDKDIIKLTAAETGFTEEMIEGTEEQETGRRIFNLLMGTNMASAYDQAIVAQAQTIRRLAKQGPCVIVGRGADYILHDLPNVLNVFVYGQTEEKIAFLGERFGDNREQAIHRMRHSDAARESYYHYLTKGKWGNLRNYHLTMDSGIGKQACAEVIIAYAQRFAATEKK